MKRLRQDLLRLLLLAFVVNPCWSAPPASGLSPSPVPSAAPATPVPSSTPAAPPVADRVKVVDSGSLVVLFDRTGQTNFVAHGPEGVLQQCLLPVAWFIALIVLNWQRKSYLK